MREKKIRGLCRRAENYYRQTLEEELRKETELRKAFEEIAYTLSAKNKELREKNLLLNADKTRVIRKMREFHEAIGELNDMLKRATPGEEDVGL